MAGMGRAYRYRRPANWGGVSPSRCRTTVFPRWSPDGNYIAAITGDSGRLVLFDFATRQWTDLVTMLIGYPVWSHDGQYLDSVPP
jgi:Tol biopolymer transport system component